MTREPACGRARRVLWPDGAPRVATHDVIAARAHVDGCDDCAAFFSEMRSIAAGVRASTGTASAPRDVRERLFTALARARVGAETRRSRVRTWAIAAGGAVAIMALVVAAIPRVPPPADPYTGAAFAALVRDHARAGTDLQLRSSEPEQVTRWIEAHVEFAMHVPVLPGAAIRGARIVDVDGDRGAVVEYDVGGALMSYFVVPRDRDRARGGAPMTGSPRIERATWAGYETVAWREPGLLRVMIGNLRPEELEAMARECARQMGHTLADASARAAEPIGT